MRAICSIQAIAETPMQNETKLAPLRDIVAAAHPPPVSDIEIEASLTDLRDLAKTPGYPVVPTSIQIRAKF